MRIHWLSNAPWGPTGYGNQTKTFVERIRDLGHEMSITAFWGLTGSILNFNNIQVYPRVFHPYGQDVAGINAMATQSDIMISLLDAWVCKPENYPEGVRWIPWFPIDSEPLPLAVQHAVEKAYKRIVFSKFGQRMMEDAGLDCYYVPHAVDTKELHPDDMAKCRDILHWPQDKFIVGMVAANKGAPSRKAFTEQLRAFAAFHEKHPDTALYLHTFDETVAGVPGIAGYPMVNLAEFIEQLGLKWGTAGDDLSAVDVIFPNQYAYIIGNIPSKDMFMVYSAMDVHMLVSMGEGFGIPIVEAQACGTPVIVGDWTAMSELCFSGWKISQDDASKWWTPQGGYQFQPHPEAITDALEAAYRVKGNQEYRKRARKGSLAYDADKVTEKYWKPVLQDIEANLVPIEPKVEAEVEMEVAA